MATQTTIPCQVLELLRNLKKALVQAEGAVEGEERFQRQQQAVREHEELVTFWQGLPEAAQYDGDDNGRMNLVSGGPYYTDWRMYVSEFPVEWVETWVRLRTSPMKLPCNECRKGPSVCPEANRVSDSNGPKCDSYVEVPPREEVLRGELLEAYRALGEFVSDCSGKTSARQVDPQEALAAQAKVRDKLTELFAELGTGSADAA